MPLGKAYRDNHFPSMTGLLSKSSFLKPSGYPPPRFADYSGAALQIGAGRDDRFPICPYGRLNKSPKNIG
jgi:hypothetical protein